MFLERFFTFLSLISTLRFSFYLQEAHMGMLVIYYRLLLSSYWPFLQKSTRKMLNIDQGCVLTLHQKSLYVGIAL